MYKFLHIGFHFEGTLKIKELEPVFSQVGDWIRYSALSWIVWTDKSPDQVLSILRLYVTPNDQVLVLAIDPTSKQGWMPQWVWTWFDSKPPNQFGGLGALGLGALPQPQGLINQPPPKK